MPLRDCARGKHALRQFKPHSLKVLSVLHMPCSSARTGARRCKSMNIILSTVRNELNSASHALARFSMLPQHCQQGTRMQIAGSSLRSQAQASRVAATGTQWIHVHRAAACRASKDDSGDIPWDEAWSKFKKSTKLPDITDFVDSNPSSSSSSAPRSFKPLSQREQEIRKSESVLLNVWTTQGFFLLCGCTVLGILVLMVSSAGQSISDPRCTLPWC